MRKFYKSNTIFNYKNFVLLLIVILSFKNCKSEIISKRIYIQLINNFIKQKYMMENINIMAVLNNIATMIF